MNGNDLWQTYHSSEKSEVFSMTIAFSKALLSLQHLALADAETQTAWQTTEGSLKEILDIIGGTFARKNELENNWKQTFLGSFVNYKFDKIERMNEKRWFGIVLSTKTSPA